MDKKVILVIRDGWGYRKEKENNAIFQVPTLNTDKLLLDYPNCLINSSGEAVGLPEGYQGNSEVGHMTIGSGRIIYPSLVRINKSIKNGDFFKIPEFLDAIENCKKNKTHLHILGFIQTEGVHSHIDHLFALLDLCKKENFSDVYIHAITDGRDSPVHESLNKMDILNKKIEELALGKIVTVSGRYYMDRDKRWERTKQIYDCIVLGEANEFEDPLEYIKESHSKDVSDEFIVPAKMKGYDGVKEKDSIIFFNFRTDRTRQFTQAIVEDKFEGWERKPLNVFYVAMTQFYSPMNAHVAFHDISLANLLGEVISKAGKKQLRISETEKYAHVTFFFNGQIEKAFPNEDRELIQSPKVATYDLKPEMSVYELTDKLVENINKNEYDLIVTNLVNCDMVGHTGVKDAIEKAIVSVDECVGKIVESGLFNDYVLLVFADHGNAEDQTTLWNTSHTLNPVPLILVSNDESLKKCSLHDNCGLQDIAPTVLDLMGIEKPREMTGKSLIMK
jgi:2,3-bisphosphoglycerate-independent phosphoglycerate mutase